MLLAPGPIPPNLGSGYDPSIQNPNFSNDVATDLEELPGLLASMAATFDPSLVWPVDLPDDGNAVILDALDSSMADVASYDATSDLAAGDGLLQASGNDFVTAFNSTPAEAFQPVPAPGTYSAPQPVTTLQVTGEINNQTNPGSLNFKVGDLYQINTTFNPALTPTELFNPGLAYLVTLQPIVNNVARPVITLAYDSNSGQWFYNGQWGPGDVGVWAGQFQAQLLLPTNPTTFTGSEISWSVTGTTPTGGGGGQQVSATFTIPSGPVAPNGPASAAILHVGQQWSLMFHGPAGATVIIDVEQNGIPLNPVSLGVLDATGTLTIFGAPTQAELGTWSESYTIGGVPWGNTFNFQVVP